jgi:cation transport ATPase
MSEHVRQVREVSSDGVATKTTRVVDNDPVAATSTQATTQSSEVESTTLATRIVWYIAGVLLVLLAFRFVFALLGANTANGFANFVYTVSYPFVAPFFGILGYTRRYGVSRVELSTLVAMAVYALIAYGITKLITIKQPAPNA